MINKNNFLSIVLALVFLMLVSNYNVFAAEDLPNELKLTGNMQQQIREKYQVPSREALKKIVESTHALSSDSGEIVRTIAKKQLENLAIVSKEVSDASTMGPDPLFVNWRRAEDRAWTNMQTEGALLLELGWKIRSTTTSLKNAIKEIQARGVFVIEKGKNAGLEMDAVEKVNQVVGDLNDINQLENTLPDNVEILPDVPGIIAKALKAHSLWKPLMLLLDKDIRKLNKEGDERADFFEKQLVFLKDKVIDEDQKGYFADAEKQIKEQMGKLLGEYYAERDVFNREVDKLFRGINDVLIGQGLGYLGIPISSDEVRKLGNGELFKAVEGKLDKIKLTSTRLLKLFVDKLGNRLRELELAKDLANKNYDDGVKAVYSELDAFIKNTKDQVDKEVSPINWEIVRLREQKMKSLPPGEQDEVIALKEKRIKEIRRKADLEISTFKAVCDRRLSDLENLKNSKINKLGETFDKWVDERNKKLQ